METGKIIKKLLSVVLSVLLTVTTLPTFAFRLYAEEPNINKGKEGDTVYFEITQEMIDCQFGDDANNYSELVGKYYFESIDDAAKYIQKCKEDILYDSNIKLPITIQLDGYPENLYPQAWVKESENPSQYEVGSDDMACAFAFNAFNFSNGDMELIDKLFEQLNISATLSNVGDLNDVNLSNEVFVEAMNKAKFSDDQKSRVQEILNEVSQYFLWDCDFEVTVDRPIKDGDINIAGQYDLYNDIWLPFSGSLTANEPLRLLGSMGAAFPYQAILLLKTFNCGVVKNWSPEMAGATITVELRMYETSRDDNSGGGNYGLNYETGTSVVMAKHVFTIPAVAQIGDKKYETLADAIAEVPKDKSQTTITMIADVDYGVVCDKDATKEVYVNNISKDQNIVIDLCGHTISASRTGNESTAILHVDNGGKLSINDNSQSKTGKIELFAGVETDPWAVSSSPIISNGSVTINGGTIISGEKSGSYAVDMNQNGFKDVPPVFVMNGGKLESTYVGLRLFANGGNEIEATINEGLISGDKKGLWVHQDGATGSTKLSKVTIKNGEIKSSLGNAVEDWWQATDDARILINISGGKYSAANDKKCIAMDDTKEEIHISGGYFNQDISLDEKEKTYIVTGKECVSTPKSDPNYGNYGYMIAEKAVAAIGEKTYPTLADAIDAVNNGETITMLTNVDLAHGISVPSGKNFTVDFDGHIYKVEKPGAGSSGTKTQAFQLLKDSTIVFMNGTIECTENNKDCTWSKDDTIKGVAMIIQNYANLTLDNMIIDATNIAHNGNNVRYAISNNSGTVEIKSSSEVIATGEDFAFDSCKYGNYTAPTVNVTGSTITGKVEATGGNINFNADTVVNGQVRVGENKSGGATGSTVTLENGATIINSDNYAFVVFGENTLNVSGTVNGIIGTNGNGYNGGSIINIKDGANITQTGDVAVYIPNGTLNISGGTITGATAVYFKSTALNITGGKLVGNGAETEYVYDGNGCNATGDALVIDSCNYPNGITGVSISGGYFKSENINAVKAFTSQGATAVTNFITGGYYSSEPDASYVAVTKEAINNTDDSTKEDYLYTIGTVEVRVDPIDEDEKENIFDKLPGDKKLDEEEKKVVEEVVDDTTKNLTDNTGVTEDFAEEIEKLVDDDKIKENHKIDFESEETTIKVKLETLEITSIPETISDKTSSEITVGKAVYDIKPLATITKTCGDVTTQEVIELTNDDLNKLKNVTVRLGVPRTSATEALIIHKSKDYPVETFKTIIKTDDKGQYVLVEMSHFSTVEVDVIDKEFNYVAEVDGDLYTSLEAAIDATKEGSIINMVADDLTVDIEKALIIDDGVILDLNGYNVKVKYLSVFGGSIIDTANNNSKGILNASKKFSYPKEFVQEDSNYDKYVPVEVHVGNSADGDLLGYSFYNVVLSYHVNTDRTGYYYDSAKAERKQAVFGSSIYTGNDLPNAAGKEDILPISGKVKLGVKVFANAGKLDIEEGEEIDQEASSIEMNIIYSDSLIANYINDTTGAFPGITWTGIDNFSGMYINGFVHSSSTSYEYNGKTKEVKLNNKIDSVLVN